MLSLRPFIRAVILTAASASLVGLTGCSMTPTSPQSAVIRHLTQAHGGVSADPARQPQAQTLLDALTSPKDVETDAADLPRLRIRVLASPRPVAYAIAPRDVFVSNGLLDFATHDQAVAAVAHELGHLMEARVGIVSALVGQPGMECPEARADHLAVRLLRQTAHPPEALAALLDRLAQHHRHDPALAGHLAHRRDLLAD